MDNNIILCHVYNKNNVKGLEAAPTRSLSVSTGVSPNTFLKWLTFARYDFTIVSRLT